MSLTLLATRNFAGHFKLTLLHTTHALTKHMHANSLFGALFLVRVSGAAQQHRLRPKYTFAFRVTMEEVYLVSVAFVLYLIRQQSKTI